MAGTRQNPLPPTSGRHAAVLLSRRSVNGVARRPITLNSGRCPLAKRHETRTGTHCHTRTVQRIRRRSVSNSFEISAELVMKGSVRSCMRRRPSFLTTRRLPPSTSSCVAGRSLRRIESSGEPLMRNRPRDRFILNNESVASLPQITAPRPAPCEV
jgi:hypothetical protein